MRADSASDDNASIDRCCSGDAQAFRPLVERYQNEAVGHALALVGNRDDALDAVQDAFLDAFRALERFDRQRSFYAWFYVILRNRCYKLLHNRQKHATDQSLESDPCQLLTSKETPQQAEQVQEALLALTPEDREILTLKHFDCLTYAELAERLELPLGTVMSRLYYARRRLRELLV